MRRLLVTGGCGFIGSNFINFFADKYPYFLIVNIDMLDYCASIYNIEENIRKSPNYIFIHGDITNPDLINEIFKKYSIDCVIHFAAQSHVQNSFQDPFSHLKDNIQGTLTLLECTRWYKKIQKFIHVSTDEVYGESSFSQNENPKEETDPIKPSNPYACTKASAELLAFSYYQCYNLPILITRGNNVYGVNQYSEKLVPRFIKQLKQNNKVTIQGNGEHVRSFMYASDAVRAFEILFFKGNIGEIYNIGCDKELEYSVKDIAHFLIKKIKNTEDYDQWITYIEDRPYNDKRYYISNTKLKKLGWKNQVDIHEGLDYLYSL